MICALAMPASELCMILPTASCGSFRKMTGRTTRSTYLESCYLKKTGSVDGAAGRLKLEPDQRQTGFLINLFLELDRALCQYDLTGRADMRLE